ncbi:AMP-binding protein [Amphritea balenae]|uniref:Long-chain-fatty-acid--CoA ligase n=1 Tax=Amphritea balenae TaxID=452629 RepID=A0A3P1SRI4_9GAMM|nr:AMP-binding protein [Amphritea balenae]RRC99649.1 long-chain fatty acid--CoA ligase [Amphritea balenae]GGK78686.1 long-chain-fatty-acid--CoA ligase [Amphritea balenae]
MDQQMPPGWIPDSLNPRGYRNLNEVLQRTVADNRDKIAFTSFGLELSYAELDRLSDAFAVYLQQETNLQPGDRIAIQMPNLNQYPVSVFGALKAGLIVVNTNPLYTPRELKHQFVDSGAKALIVHKSMAHNVDKIIAETPLEHVFVTQVADLHSPMKRLLINSVIKYVKRMEPAYNLPQAVELRHAINSKLGQQPTAVELNSSDIAVLQYTGGTTGVSKGAMLTHANLISNCLQGVKLISGADDHWADKVVAPLPLYHIYAFTISMAVLELGGNNLLIANPRDINGFVKELKNHSISAFIGLNTLFVALCNHKDFAQVDFSRLKVTLSGGMALTFDAANTWREATGCKILEAYGLTETSPAVAMNPPLDIRIGTIGPPVAETEVKIIGTEGQTLGEGEPGELCVKGPQVMLGYWQRESATSTCFTDDGYFITGDVAIWEPDGYLKIVDRAKDMINVSGFNVYPNEVEDVVTSHPKVVECAAVGEPDKHSGELVKLYVVAKEEVSVKEIRDWCKERLTAYKVPKVVEFTDELPKSNVGKVLRRMLRKDAA